MVGPKDDRPKDGTRCVTPVSPCYRGSFGSLFVHIDKSLMNHIIELLRFFLGYAREVGLIAEGQSEPAIRQAFFDRWVSPRRTATIADLQRGKNAGELRSDTEPDLLNDAIFGAIYYRFLLGSGTFTRRFGEELVDQVIRGHRSGNARS